MRSIFLCGIVGMALLFAAPAHADKFDSTLDIAPVATATLLHVDAKPLRGEWVAAGATERIGLSLEGFRFGAGIGFFGTPNAMSSALGYRGAAWGIPIEVYAGYAFGRAHTLRPYVEVRAAATHIFAPMATATGTDMVSVWSLSVMPRVGVRIPIGEFFFFDVGVGVGAGPERAQISWAFGLPIPTANL